MATQWKQNVPNTVSIDLGPYDIYGKESTFILHQKIKGNTNTTNVNATWLEVKDFISTPNTVTAIGETLIGSTKIVVGDTTGVMPGQVYKSGTVYVYVTSVTSSTSFNIRRPTGAVLPANAVFTQVGNTGIYETSLTLQTLGQYLIIISNPDIGLLNEASKVEVVGNNIDDVNGNLLFGYGQFNTKLDKIAGLLGGVDTSVSGKLIL